MSKKNEQQLPSLEGVDKEGLAKTLSLAMSIRRLTNAAQKFFEAHNSPHSSHSGLPISDPREGAKASLVSAAITFVQGSVNPKMGLDQTRDILIWEAQGGNKNRNEWEAKLDHKQNLMISGIMDEIKKDPTIEEKLRTAEVSEKKL